MRLDTDRAKFCARHPAFRPADIFPIGPLPQPCSSNDPALDGNGRIQLRGARAEIHRAVPRPAGIAGLPCRDERRQGSGACWAREITRRNGPHGAEPALWMARDGELRIFCSNV